MKPIQRASIDIAGISVEVFNVDGTNYCSASSVSTAIGKQAQFTSDFLASKAPEALPHKGLTLQKIRLGRTSLTLVPPAVVSAFWFYWARKGNTEAIALTQALVAETIERRANGAFGVKLTEAQYEAQTTELRLALINKAIPEYLQGGVVKVKSLEGLTQAEKDVVFRQVGAYREADQRITNSWHYMDKYNELVGDRLWERLSKQEQKDIDRQAKAYKKEMQAKIEQGTHVSVSDYLLS